MLLILNVFDTCINHNNTCITFISLVSMKRTGSYKIIRIESDHFFVIHAANSNVLKF